MTALRQVFLGLAFVLLCSSVRAAEGSAPEMPASAVDIKSPTLLKALIALQQQTGLQFICPTDGTGETPVAPVAGIYTPKVVVAKMLKDSGVRYEFINERTVAISSNKTASTKPLRISAVDAGTSLAASTETAPQSDGLPENGRHRVADAGQEDSTEDMRSAALDEVVVTGSHIRGNEGIGSKLIVIDRDYIDKSGFATIEDVLKTLPQNAPGPSEDFNPVEGNRSIGNVGRGTGVNLRGLGSGATLVLVNGVRQTVSGTFGAFVDISNIPLAAVDRIEILPDGASAMYGSDAIGGVVNIILRGDYQGFETRARLGTLDGDANEIRVSQLAGAAWTKGRGMVGYEYYKRDDLSTSDRLFSASSDQRRNGGDDFSDFQSNPANILDPNTFAPAYAVPSGQDGTAISAADLILISPDFGNANRRNINAGQHLLADQKMHSFFADVSQQLNERFEIFANGRYSTRPYEVLPPPSGITLNVPSSNPFFVDPFGNSSSIFMTYSFADDFAFPQTGRTNTFNGTLGTRVKLGGTWQATVRGSYAREAASYHQISLDFGLLDEALGNFPGVDNPDTTYNPLADGFFNPFGDNSATSSVVRSALLKSEPLTATSTTMTGGVFADGTLFSIPGGAVKLALGLDYRKEELDTQLSPGSEFSRVKGLDRRDSAAFSELMIPLVGESNARPGLHRLQASIAARYEHYSDWGSTVVPKFGLNWNPIQSLKIRGTWGESFKAPRLVDSDDTVFNPGSVFPAFFPDPQSPAGTFTLAVFGANKNLREERGVEWTAGFDFRPEWIPGFELSLTYFNNEYKDRVGTGGTPGQEFFILFEENLWASIIHRNPSQAQIDEVCTGQGGLPPADFCASLPLEAIVDLRLQNIAFTRVNGLDLNLAHSLQTGRGQFNFGINGNYTFHNEFALAETTPRVDILDTVGNPLSLRLRGMASWSYRGFDTHAAVNHAPAYENPFSGLSGTPQDVSSWTTLDFGVGYRTAQGDGWTNSVALLFNVVNAFDEDPPFINAALGYDTANADPYGRLLSLEITKSW